MSQGATSSQFLVAEILSAETNTSERWKPVTLYVVRIAAVGRREVWTVYRRYSKFYDLNVQLYKRFQDHALPPIPPKRLIGKEDPLFIEQRRHELEEFLNALLKKPVEISLSEEVCLFLEVPEPLRLCFLETDARAPALLPLPDEAPQAIGMSGGAPDESRVTWLLAQLQDNPNNKVIWLRIFEDWILRTAPRLTEANVQLLYLGFERQGGLLEEVGAFEHSEVSSLAALGLLGKLLSHENCGEAPLFCMVLRRLDTSVLSRMRLQHHIHSNRGQNNRLDAFRVLNSLELPLDRLTALLQDDFAQREFRRWQEFLQSPLRFRTLHRPSQTLYRTPALELFELPSPALSTREYRKIAETAFTSVQMCLTTFALPDEPAGVFASGEPRSRRARTADAPGAGPSEEADTGAVMRSATAPATAATPSEGGALRQQWRHVRCPEASWRQKYCMHAAYQHVPNAEHSDDYVLRSAMRLPFPAFHVACVLLDHSHFIRKALSLKEQELAPAVVERLRQLAAGHLVSQMHCATTIKTLHLGTEHEACSELLECHLGTPSAPHVPVRLPLLRSLRIIPAPRDAGCLKGGAAPCDGAEAGCRGGVGAKASAEATGLPHASSPKSAQAPSYLFFCTAVPPVAPARQHDGESSASSSVRRVSSNGLHSDRHQGNGHHCDGHNVGAAIAPTEIPGSTLTPELGVTCCDGAAAVTSPAGSRASAPRRMSIQPSGVLIQPQDGGSQADVSLCALLHRDTLRLINGDLLGERLLFWRTLENVLFVLEALGTLPDDLEHPLRELQARCLSGAAAGRRQRDDSLGSPRSSRSYPSFGSRGSSRSSRRSLEVELVEEEMTFL